MDIKNIYNMLNEHNFILTAMKFYDNSQILTIKEFSEDLKKFVYLKKLFNRYLEHGDLKERLILNHIIVLHNLFGIATTELLFYKTDKEHWNLLGTFLIFLDRMPESVPEFNLERNDIDIDRFVLDILESNT